MVVAAVVLFSTSFKLDGITTSDRSTKIKTNKNVLIKIIGNLN